MKYALVFNLAGYHNRPENRRILSMHATSSAAERAKKREQRQQERLSVVEFDDGAEWAVAGYEWRA